MEKGTCHVVQLYTNTVFRLANLNLRYSMTWYIKHEITVAKTDGLIILYRARIVNLPNLWTSARMNRITNFYKPVNSPKNNKICRYAHHHEQEKIKISIPAKINWTPRHTVEHKGVSKPVSESLSLLRMLYACLFLWLPSSVFHTFLVHADEPNIGLHSCNVLNVFVLDCNALIHLNCFCL